MAFSLAIEALLPCSLFIPYSRASFTVYFYILLYRSRESGSWATLFVPGLGQAPLGHSPIAQLVRAPH